MVCCILHHVPFQGGKLCSTQWAVNMVWYFLVFLCIPFSSLFAVHETFLTKLCWRWTHVSCLFLYNKIVSWISRISSIWGAKSKLCLMCLAAKDTILDSKCTSSSRLGGIYRRWPWKLMHSLLELSRDFHSTSSVVGFHLWRKKTSCIVLISFLPWHFRVTDLSRKWSS
jgi:hypothetical protein